MGFMIYKEIESCKDVNRRSSEKKEMYNLIDVFIHVQ